jgi:hypothetical protein
MTAETWTARAKLASFHVPQFKVGEDGSRVPHDNEPGPPAPALPAWRDEAELELRIAALELEQMVLQDLRDGLEGREPRRARRKEPALPTWDNPFVYVQIEYPLSDNKELVPPAEIEDEVQALWWIGSKLNEEWAGKSRVITTLQILTRYAAFVLRNGKTHPIVPLPFFDRYQAMTEPERERFLQQWFSPISHGDRYFEDDAGRTSPDPNASIEVHGNGKSFRAAVVFEVYPLLLDLEAGRAFYTLKAGLPWTGDMGSPATWTEPERDALWSALFKALEALTAYYEFEEEPLPDEVVVCPEDEAKTEREIWDSVWSDADEKKLVSPEEAKEALAATSIAGGDKKRFPLAFGRAPVDRDALSIIQKSHRLTFPRQWSKIPRWKDLTSDEVAHILNEHGQAAFRDLKKETKDPKARGALLRKKPVAGQREYEWPVELTDEAVRSLKARCGYRGFLIEDEDRAESLYKCLVDCDGNLLEMWLSWNGLAGPLVADWRNRVREDVDETKRKLEAKRLPLFGDLDDREVAKLDRLLHDLTLYERGRMLMEAILGQVGVQRRNPIEIRADAFKLLLWENGQAPQNWKHDVEAALTSLSRVKFVLRGGGIKAKGVFLASYITNDEDNPNPRAFRYMPRGRGGHGEGFFILEVSRAFLGCLRFFEDGAARLKSGADTILLNYAKELDKNEKKLVHGNFVQWDAGSAFYSAAAGLTAEQKNLDQFIDINITVKRDAIPKGRKREQSKPQATDAREPRLFDQSFCPLLPEGQSFAAVLGHFRKNPEAGFTLYGTKSGQIGAPGQKPGGLIEKLGYALPPGRANDQREDVVKKTLSDLKVVVVDYRGGQVIGRLSAKDRTDGGNTEQWLPLERFGDLSEDRLCKRLKIFMFLPPDGGEARRKALFEKKHNVLVPKTTMEADAAAWGTSMRQTMVEPQARPAPAGEIFKGPEDGWRGLALPERLDAARKYRNLQRIDLARIFGVTPGAVTRWLKGLKLGENIKDAKPIPDDLAALMVRWIETGQEPTPAELVMLPSRSRTPRTGGLKGGRPTR